MAASVVMLDRADRLYAVWHGSQQPSRSFRVAVERGVV
jgi:hypothetical protein